MENKPRITYSHTVNLGNYSSHRFEVEMFAADDSIEEICATTDFVFAHVESTLVKAAEKIKHQGKKGTSESQEYIPFK